MKFVKLVRYGSRDSLTIDLGMAEVEGKKEKDKVLGNKFGSGDMHTNKRKIKDTRFYVVQQKPTSTKCTHTQLTL
jgi:hypothetical protein